MKFLIVYSHFDEQSYNHAVLESVQKALTEKNHEFKIRDLYHEKFQPVLHKKEFFDIRKGQVEAEILKEQDMINWADIIVFIYPIWWGSMPAILKGYIDRVFTYGFAYKYGANGPEGLLSSKKAIIFNTMGANTKDLKILFATKAMSLILNKGVLGFCGIKTIVHKYLSGINSSSTPEYRKNLLLEVEKVISKVE